ncbi:hypothetical protein NIES593_11270 [Hydrococcus rivularis NIES-593]|uniref:O-antigen polymerase n=1 Tax=Hydrococcus rivularis NIES-593 TaxID=1921803 RepID=A0A1U7HHK1_9CYAN|nr:hypothetical protein [Hydrococcus rivularis]OKH23034.1 hypothetical protein NIES593_11270 [Hydrococcus rivularis NIES-593]
MSLSYEEDEKIATRKKKKSFSINNSTLILLAFSTAFYSRIFCSITGAPSALNFFHFVSVSFALVVALATSRTRDRKQIALSWTLLWWLLVFLGTMVASALINGAGIINVVFNFLLLGEPFMFLLAIVVIPLSPASLKQMRLWLLVSALINLLLAQLQRILLLSGNISAAGMRGTMDATDGVQGVFFVTGAGGYVSAAVSVSAALYFFLYVKAVPLWIRIFGLIGAIHQILISDTKQVLLTSILAWVVLVLTKVQNIKKLLGYLIAFALAVSAFVWAAQNLEAFSVYGYWFGRSYLFGIDDPQNSALGVKSEGIRMVLSHYHSPLNWFFGLGPGHTLGRLGGWSIREYWTILSRLGATDPPLYDEIWKFINGNWLALTTTLVVPLFSWAGIWGDLGWVGLGVYLYLGFIVWQRLCLDDLSRFLLLTVFVYGFFLTQMEEPGFMLTIAAFIGLRWHENRSKFQNYLYERKSQLQFSVLQDPSSFSPNRTP